MFWIALELSNPKMGLITWLSSLVKKYTALKNDRLMKTGNTAKGSKHRSGRFKEPYTKNAQVIQRLSKILTRSQTYIS